MRLCLHMMFNLPFFILFQSTVYFTEQHRVLILQHKHLYKKIPDLIIFERSGRIGDGCSLHMMYSKKFWGDVKLHMSVGIFDLGFIEEFFSF